MRHLVLGGVRSGKSAYAQEVVMSSSMPVCYIATSQVLDDGIAQRVQQHKQSRPKEWQVIEEPFKLGATLTALSGTGKAVIVECLTMWLTNLICLENDARLEEEKAALLNAITFFDGILVLVSSEVGLGIMPMNSMARRFGDEIGVLNQTLAKLTDRVTFVAAGLPMSLKS